ncbi:hypothetical protein, variant 1 [Aphanomyces invadans]|uniref:SANT domain-containing protein n=1 Tax=Aphanomyces invadans TaxID=157072 RepID=A0A024UMK4_9STRA|nr:hypothetical protein, variant 1 [Aphanomyces invadans]ETW07524.1 hypothetical protein, variant 1 [Aphanomyces invadans]|eukprot:XP_008863617.1 hypothetical protein, variant 1 [Aphanomyces invadans]
MSPAADSPPALPIERSVAHPPKRSSKRSLESTSASTGSPVESYQQSAGMAATSHSTSPNGHSVGTGHTAAMNRYFSAVRALYAQGRPRGNGTWASLEAPFGCAAVVESTDTLRHLLSPLRPSHVLDTWTPFEITCFEIGITQLGKQFHYIQQHLIPTKSTRDVVHFYYMWKKYGLEKAEWAEKDAAHDHFGMKRMKQERDLHGILPTAYDLLSDEDDSTTLAVKQSSLLTQQSRPKRAAAGAGVSTNLSATHPNLARLAALRTDVTKVYTAMRGLYGAAVDHPHTVESAPSGRLPCGVLAAPILSVVRPPHLLDGWSPWELAVFECGLDMYGKQFDAVAALLPRKSTSDAIAMYYVWKKASPAVYRRMKTSWPASPFGKIQLQTSPRAAVSSDPNTVDPTPSS